MVLVYEERVNNDFKGTIIDIETIGDFCRGYHDSREYGEMTPVIFGYIKKDKLEIICAKQSGSVKNLKKAIDDVVPTLNPPFYAFNSVFEKGVLHHFCGLDMIFGGELNTIRYESKRSAVRSLGIENYDDPFFDDGNKCRLAWLKECESLREGGVFSQRNSMKHNRSCLLKERDILLKRGYRTPDKLELA